MSCLVELLTVRMFESHAPHVDNFGDDGHCNFFRQYGADIESDRHIHAL